MPGKLFACALARCHRSMCGAFINGYSVYITAQDEEGIRKELAAVEGCSPSDLVLYVFEGYTRIPQYKAV